MGAKEKEVCRNPYGVAWNKCRVQKEAQEESWVNGRWVVASLEEVGRSLEEVVHPLVGGHKPLDEHLKLGQEILW